MPPGRRPLDIQTKRDRSRTKDLPGLPTELKLDIADKIPKLKVQLPGGDTNLRKHKYFNTMSHEDEIRRLERNARMLAETGEFSDQFRLISDRDGAASRGKDHNIKDPTKYRKMLEIFPQISGEPDFKWATDSTGAPYRDYYRNTPENRPSRENRIRLTEQEEGHYQATDPFGFFNITPALRARHPQVFRAPDWTFPQE